MVRSRKALNDTLLALLEEKPFDQITIREITGKAGIGYATFFRHYPTKEALLNALATDQIRELLEMAFPLLFSEDSRAAAKALCTYVDERAKLWSALLTGGAAGAMREEFIRQARAIAVAQPGPKGWLPDDLKVVYGVGGTIDILAWWLSQRDAYSVDQIAEFLDRLVIIPTLSGVTL